MQQLIKPNALKKGDKVAVVSLSSGVTSLFKERYLKAKKQFEETFEVQLVEMPHTLDSIEAVYQNPKNRLDDLMQAFLNPEIRAILTTIGGDDTIRLLPLMNKTHFEIIKNNPKIFMGMSDTTVNHFMCLKAGVSSFYTPSLLFGYGENGGIPDYIVQNTKKMLFQSQVVGNLSQSDFYITQWCDWLTENHLMRRKRASSDWCFLGAQKTVSGRLIGGCFEVLNFLNGTSLWPNLSQWKDTILFIETSEDMPKPVELIYFFRNLAVQGILSEIKGILLARPGGEFSSFEKVKEEQFIANYCDYENAVLKVLEEFEISIPVVSRLDFGHTVPQFILPYGALTQINPLKKSITILECGVV